MKTETEPTFTPMIQRYNDLRKTLPDDAILLFRLGDFYEAFFNDARDAAKILNLTLTKRSGFPMCGIMFTMLEGCKRTLLESGRRVAICESSDRTE